MATPNKLEVAPLKKRRTGRIILGLVAAALICTVVFLLSVGRWLVKQDPLEKAQAIVVLSGRLPLRAMEAAKLYREGYAPKVWLTHSAQPGATLEAMGIHYNGEDFYNLQVLLHDGVPADSIRVLQPPIVNTADEISAISAQMAAEKDSTVIIVTSKVHTRRVRILWHRVAARRGRAVIRAASDDPFEPGHWWRTSRDALDVVRESLGILNAWAGMPLHPAN
ncbi:MAG: YdcF family protein [Candidatus Acidiferrum sp.]